MTSKHTATRKTFDLTPSGWVRLALYVVLVLAAVVAGVGSEFGLGQFEGVAAQLLVVLGAVTGTTASMNVSKAPDHEMKLSEVFRRCVICRTRFVICTWQPRILLRSACLRRRWSGCVRSLWAMVGTRRRYLFFVARDGIIW